MNGTDVQPLTARTMLFGTHDASLQLERALRSAGTIGEGDAPAAMAPVVRETAAERFIEIVASLLDVEIVDILRRGWQQHETLQAAARRSIADPGSQEVVELATHRMSSVQRPEVRVYVDEELFATVHFTVELTALIHALVGIVVAGKLVGLRSGKADLEARLLCEGELLASTHREIDLFIAIDLGDGLQLLAS